MRYTKRPKNSNFGHTLKLQTAICALLLVVLSFIKITSDDVLVKAKRAVALILTQQTDVHKELEKLKSVFLTDKAIESLNPVSDFINPAKDSTLVKGFGVQDADESGFHYGVDLKVGKNQNIVAAQGGEISEIATNQEYGTYILIKHSDEIFTLYAKLNEVLPGVGERVEKGQAIGRANQETNTIHFEIRRNDTYLDPTEFIDFGAENG